MYRLRERLGYKHVSDFLQDQTGGELAGDIAFLRVDDEVQTQRMTIAILKALRALGLFSGGNGQPAQRTIDGEEIIDTTSPDFAKNFKGFTSGNPQPREMNRQTSTEIKIG